AAALDELEQEVEEALTLAEVVELDHVRMVEPRENHGLAPEALGEGRILARVEREHLEGDEALDPRLARLVDGAHAALAEEREDLELREAARDLGERRCGTPTGPGPGGRGVAPRPRRFPDAAECQQAARAELVPAVQHGSAARAASGVVHRGSAV